MKSLQEVLISADCSIRCFLDPVSDAGDWGDLRDEKCDLHKISTLVVTVKLREPFDGNADSSIRCNSDSVPSVSDVGVSQATRRRRWFFRQSMEYRLNHKYMRQPRSPGSGVSLSDPYISRVCILGNLSGSNWIWPCGFLKNNLPVVSVQMH
jgi:hypothetical protein